MNNEIFPVTHTHSHISSRLLLTFFGLCVIVGIPVFVWYTVYRTQTPTQFAVDQYDKQFIIVCTDNTYKRCRVRYTGAEELHIVAFDMIFAQSNIQTESIPSSHMALSTRTRPSTTVVTGFTTQLQQKYTVLQYGDDLFTITGIEANTRSVQKDGVAISQIVFINNTGAQMVRKLDSIRVRLENN